ncbi:MAG: A/G-specific adenine glycosylase [Akkermansiaceae bacterium]|nr:A/G-specific adenine glycosylase [Akkermansiaceae bacterium]
MKPAASKHPLRNKRALRSALLRWFEAHREDHPWRQTTDPYAILVSEIMLQQTTVAAVRQNRRFEKFLATFPDLPTLAAAKERTLLQAWEGLGYYNRVRNLQKTALAVLNDHHGTFPSDPTTLQTLPGVGRYTAGAVATFAFGKSVPIVDANIARVLSRLFNDPTPIDSTPGQALLWDRAAQLVDPNSPREFNSAIMELGQTHCSARRPDCPHCPARQFCQTTKPEHLPTKKPKRAAVQVTEHVLLVRKPNGHILLAQESGSRRNGFWKLPERDQEAVADLPLLATHKYAITHHRVTFHIHSCPPTQVPPPSKSCPEQYHPAKSLPSLPIPSPIRKALDRLL